MKPRIVEIDMSNLNKTIETWFRNVTAQTAMDIRDELSEFTYQTMLDFYDNYDPKIYKRGKRNFIGVIGPNGTRAFRGYYKNHGNGKTYTAGILLTPDVMYDDYHGSTELVLHSVFAGYHGGPIRNDSEEYSEGAFSSRKSSEYTGAVYYPAPRMSPSPMELIEDKRDYIVDNIDEYWNNAAKKVEVRFNV